MHHGQKQLLTFQITNEVFIKLKWRLKILEVMTRMFLFTDVINCLLGSYEYNCLFLCTMVSDMCYKLKKHGSGCIIVMG